MDRGKRMSVEETIERVHKIIRRHVKPKKVWDGKQVLGRQNKGKRK